ncbi:hypothetical protein B484DRAFT_452867 [Ochromonadaceae sp. CCMP2298]|nr:hypothetical protein B484DRAFT_452867 [Ochromonadaceae sp. CCMP2298]|mmetsp:Transcript_32192/g.70934  ORF Transcript_32192/g.70934 Transcript_32192/m.70934 type:complete len:348 (-) Transcript_32192:200-1243(-)
MLSFDEFRAVNNREKARAAEEEKRNEDPAPNPNPNSKKVVKGGKRAAKATTGAVKAPAPEAKKRSLIGGAIDSAGEFLEVPQMQGLYVLLIVLDTFASLGEMYASCAANFPANQYALNRGILVRLLNSFTTFTTLFFMVEIVAVLLVFRLAIFSHWGYVLDVCTSGAQAYLERSGYGKVTRLLNILRYWRMVRLLNSLLSNEKDAHDRTTALLESSDGEVRRLQLEGATLKGDIQKEKEARDAIEDMLLAYKEEVDTLNEALKIAAMDIAEVAQADDDFALSEESEEDSASRDEDGFVDATASQFSRAGNKSAVMRAVMEDSGRSASMGSAGPATFLVHEDGTFEQK